MKNQLLTTAVTAALCAAAGGAFADQPVNQLGPEKQSQWSQEQYITVCGNNGQGNNNETVTTSTGLHCTKFVPLIDKDDFEPNIDIGEPCIDTNDCDPQPAD